MILFVIEHLYHEYKDWIFMSTIEDKVFGKLHYGEGMLNINFFGQIVQIYLLVECDKENYITFDNKQYHAYESLMKALTSLFLVRRCGLEFLQAIACIGKLKGY